MKRLDDRVSKIRYFLVYLRDISGGRLRIDYADRVQS